MARALGALNPDYAVESVAKSKKALRNVQLEQFYDLGIFINMARRNLPGLVKIGKQVLQNYLQAGVRGYRQSGLKVD